MNDEIPRAAQVAQACGRIGAHEPHTWLSRKVMWCEGGGEPGRSAPPRMVIEEVLQQSAQQSAQQPMPAPQPEPPVS